MSTPGNIRDAILVLRCQQADGQAFAELVERWHGRLCRHACRLTGDRDAAEEIAQESWLAVLKGIQGLHDADLFPAWLFRIVSHKSRDWIRRQQRRRGLLAWWRDAEPPRPRNAGGSRLDALHAALERLSVEQRALIALYYEEGFSTQEIAAVLDIPQGTVKSRLYHARNAVRECMEDFEHESVER